MSKLSLLIQLAYDSAYDFKLKKQYSEPVIYDAKGNLAKRWFVYYSYRNPDTGKLERQPYVDTGINQHKNLADRRAAAKVLQQAISGILRAGYNPFLDEEDYNIEEVRKLTIPEAVEFVLQIKRHSYGTGYTDFKSRLNLFAAWLKKKGFENRHITSVNKNVVINYLNDVLKKNSASNRNNARSRLSIFFQVLEDNMIIPKNFVPSINVVASKPQRNKSYTSTQQREIFEYMAAHDPVLLLYVKFVSYNFVRPIEVNRLLIEDLDLLDKRIQYRSKTKLKIKLIPQILIDDLPDLSQFDRKAFLFGENAIGQPWATKIENKRGHYTKRFERVKEALELGKDYGIYSFRHTFIAMLYHELLKESTQFEAKSRLMLITGHATMNALEEYLRDIDAELPQDYSYLIRKNIQDGPQ
ncbi:MAG TPA: site-specific integrase [Flavobacterium sp.]|jgi:integrase